MYICSFHLSNVYCYGVFFFQVEQEIQILEAAMEDVKEANELLRHSHRTPKMMKLANEEIKLKEELEQAQEALREREKLENNLVNVWDSSISFGIHEESWCLYMHFDIAWLDCLHEGIKTK